jgi:hypothetical protein
MASSSSCAQRQAGAVYVSALQLRGDSPKFAGHDGGDLCDKPGFGCRLAMCLEMDGRRGSCDGGGCEVEVVVTMAGNAVFLRASSLCTCAKPGPCDKVQNFDCTLCTRSQNHQKLTTHHPHIRKGERRSEPPGEPSSEPYESTNPPHIKMAEDNSAAWPQADQALSQEILDLVQQATQ